MRKLIAKAWMTLDGVFDADNMDTWFDPYNSDARAAHIQETILGSDAFIYGRTTYQMLAPYWSTLENNEFGIADRLNEAPKYIVSSTLQDADWDNSTIISDNVVEAIANLKEQPGQDIMIDGSATLVQSLMDRDLLDEYQLVVHPVIMGSGKHYFKDGMDMTRLELIQTKPLDLGVIVMRYQPTIATEEA